MANAGKMQATLASLGWEGLEEEVVVVQDLAGGQWIDWTEPPLDLAITKIFGVGHLLWEVQEYILVEMEALEAMLG